MNTETYTTEERQPRVMGFTELKGWLRHRHPMVFLDRVLDYEPADYIKTLMAVSGQTDAIAGHFPERAIFPASHMMQAIAQSAIILFQLSTAPLTDDEVTLIGSLKSRFTRVVVPGDQIIFELHCESLRGNFLTFSCRAAVSGHTVGMVKGSLVRQKVSDLGVQLW
ncbi:MULTISPECIES: 3-hydroxyacyl-ACP dehydratase FabZ family protein [unclassified Brenneria]|uniref:3-hydroxyacyl-ACP dehydratase FabZ family protein n=1 Tax=unclassified Brenneria TaxID=2634434 RepID=UPI0018F09E16|nr:MULTISPECIES: beta-hydroxyacyl-ACP dehydratase [unclassified Brenneria]MBJ7221972.1 beta-hydroxyacyl-ACP dehydratase [Brenneria sp. L3-3C-1]MEE3643214.1 beta-hydroxyacyl-ACP dehydratase [Brenneria sp. L3_3C_1]MEE3650598.1 beta-hydroxyacyl-ACP dehydratase [Brenneria sp. HEZEL_4_2_4]NPD00553.1 beta-hydroxyacyl-ACP dehydratase [Brenneria sp. hezel4-2-4]